LELKRVGPADRKATTSPELARTLLTGVIRTGQRFGPAYVAEVLAGPELAKMRRWVYGIEEAPDACDDRAACERQGGDGANEGRDEPDPGIEVCGPFSSTSVTTAGPVIL